MRAQRRRSAKASKDSPVARRTHDAFHDCKARTHAHRRGSSWLGNSHGRQRASLGGHRLSFHRSDSALLQATEAARSPVISPRPTTIVEAPRLSKRLGATIVLASETFQYTGSFKFRAAYNVAANVSNAHIITASSGNFGQALAYACALFKKRCTVVMPATAPKVKVDAVREYGAEVDLVDVQKKARLERLGELAREFPTAYVASPYDDPFVIDGNATLATELFALDLNLDFIVAPIGGGGLTSGIVKAVKANGKKMQVLAAEPALSNDAAESFRAGHLVAQKSEGATIADGARVLRLGDRNWEILRNGLSGVIEV